MKKLFTVLSFLLVLTTAWGQDNKKMEKMVQDALKRGPGSNGAYCITNRSNQTFSALEMKEYVEQMGYHVGVATDKQHNRFGEIVRILDKLEFYTRETMDQYAFSVLHGSGSLTLNDLHSDCSMCCPVATVRGQGWFSYSGNYRVYYPVFWSGNVTNGLIDGHGIGFVQLEDNWGYFEADFQSGFPTENFEMKTLTRQMKSGVSRYAAARHEDLMSLAPNSMGTIRKAIQGYTSKSYETDALRLEEEYRKVLTLNESNYERFSQEGGLVQGFINLYEEMGFDPRNDLSKAREILDVYTLLNVLKIDRTKRYRTASLLYGWVWNSHSEQADKKLLKDAKAILDNTESIRSGEMKAFVAKMTPTVKNAIQEVEDNLRKESANYQDFLDDSDEQSRLWGTAYSSSGNKEYCRVLLVKKDGSPYAKGRFHAGYRYGSSHVPRWSQAYVTDEKGNSIVSWSQGDSNPNYIMIDDDRSPRIYIDNLEMSKGGTYTICIDGN